MQGCGAPARIAAGWRQLEIGEHLGRSGWPQNRLSFFSAERSDERGARAEGGSDGGLQAARHRAARFHLALEIMAGNGCADPLEIRCETGVRFSPALRGKF